MLEARNVTAPELEVVPPHPEREAEAHERLSSHLWELLKSSDRAKLDKYPKWNRVKDILFLFRKTADLTNYNLSREQRAIAEEMLQDIVFIPFAWSILSSNLASHWGVLQMGRPLFRIEPEGEQYYLGARMLQSKIDYGIELNAGLAALYRQYWDGYAFNCGVVMPTWEVQYHNRIVATEEPMINLKTGKVTTKIRKDTVPAVTYEGTMLRTVRPEDFFSDSSFKVSEFQRGLFAAHRYVESASNLYEGKDKIYFNLDKILDGDEVTAYSDMASMVGQSSMSDRLQTLSTEYRKHHVELYEMQCKIRPKKYGLSDSDKIETWVFTIAPNQTIVRSRPLNNLHGKFTYSVNEPLPLTDDYISPSLLELIEPLQDEINFIVNTNRIETRRNQGASTLYREAAIDSRYLSEMRPPRNIPVKPTWTGPLGDAMLQLPDRTSTAKHLELMGIFMESAERASGVSSLNQAVPLQGVRSATEVGSIQQSSISRLQVMAGLIGHTAHRELGELVAMDNMQYTEKEFIAQVAGEDAEEVVKQLKGNNHRVFGKNFFEGGPADIIGRYMFPAYNPLYPAHQTLQGEAWIRAFEATMNVYPAIKEEYEVHFQKMLENFIRSRGLTADIPTIFRKITPEEKAAAAQAQAQAAGAQAGAVSDAQAPGKAREQMMRGIIDAAKSAQGNGRLVA